MDGLRRGGVWAGPVRVGGCARWGFPCGWPRTSLPFAASVADVDWVVAGWVVVGSLRPVGAGGFVGAVAHRCPEAAGGLVEIPQEHLAGSLGVGVEA